MFISLREGLGAVRDQNGVRISPWTLLLSVGLHGVLLLALAYLALGRPIILPPLRSIQVEIITPEQYRAATETSPVLSAPPLAEPERPVQRTNIARPAEPVDGMTTATNLLANRVLMDPENREVRETLPTLDRTERIIQLCNIEGLEQLRLARPGPLPDSLSPSAFATTIVDGYKLDAPAAAYRAARKWYAVQFTCTVTPDFESVTEFRFAVGDAIPESEWEDHDLLAEDDDE